MTASRIIWLLLLGWSSGVFSVLAGIAFFVRVLEAPTEPRLVSSQRENDQ